MTALRPRRRSRWRNAPPSPCCSSLPAAPLPLRRDGALRRRALRVLQPLLPDAPLSELDQVYRFLLPLLEACGLVQRHGGQCTTALGAAALLEAPLAAQRARLVEAWLYCAAPDAWLRRLRVADSGLDAPALRRRLVQWAQALPPDRLFAPEATYDALTATFGPLADAQTHGFRVVRRPPWRRRSGARVWQAALRGPLAWLGVVAWQDGRVYRPTADAPPDGAWRYGAPGEVTVSFGALDADALRLAQGGRWVRGDAHGLTVQVAAASGVLGAQVRALLARRAGEAPDGWGSPEDRAPALRLAEGVLLLADAPGDLERALRGRSVRRYAQRLAPGVALVRAEHVAAVTRALARQGIAVDRPPMGGARAGSGGALPAAPLAAGECAALLAACACYRRYAPEGLPLVMPATLEAAVVAGADAAAARGGGSGAGGHRGAGGAGSGRGDGRCAAAADDAGGGDAGDAAGAKAAAAGDDRLRHGRRRTAHAAHGASAGAGAAGRALAAARLLFAAPRGTNVSAGPSARVCAGAACGALGAGTSGGGLMKVEK
jgi:hypothetical protein